MPVPKLDDYGLLPPGVWDCTLDEIAARFATNEHRRGLWSGLLAFLASEYRPSGLVCPVWIDGSFTRSKLLPEDIDVVLDLSALAVGDAFAVALSLHLHHDSIHLEYHVDAYARHPDIPRDLAAFFQYAGPKCAAELQIDERRPKGILRVQA